jgi:hypothetical protein
MEMEDDELEGGADDNEQVVLISFHMATGHAAGPGAY